MKQETLEEAAEKATNILNLSWENEYAYNKFLEGAKWQQERSYSEEEVLVLLHKRDKHNWDRSLWQTPKEWLNKFKKQIK